MLRPRPRHDHSLRRVPQIPRQTESTTKKQKDHEKPNTSVRQHTSHPLCMVAETSEFHREKLEVFRVVAKTDLVHTESVVFDTDQNDGSGLRIEPDGNHEEWTWNAGAAVRWQRQPQEEPGHKNKETEISFTGSNKEIFDGKNQNLGGIVMPKEHGGKIAKKNGMLWKDSRGGTMWKHKSDAELNHGK